MTDASEPQGSTSGAETQSTLSRRPAPHYQISPQDEHWLLKALQAVTPGLTFLTDRYERRWLGRDVPAGLTVAAYLVPQVMAYSAIVGVPPVTALTTSLVALVVYAIVGGSRVLSVGPESTIALLAGLSVADMAGGDPQRVIELTAALSLVVAGWCFVGRAFRLGVIADLLSQPLLVGYLAGAGVLMIAGQLGKLTGTSVEGESIVDQVVSFVEVANGTHMTTLLVGLGTLVGIVVIHLVFPKWPAVLIGVVGAMVAYVVLDLGALGVAAVGEVPTGSFAPRIPIVSWSELKQLVVAGLGVAVMAYSDNMLFARGFPPEPLPGERPSDVELEPQGELSALGVVHLAVGAFGGFPVSSSGSRTALAVTSGAMTQVYSLTAAVCVLLVISVAGSITDVLPQAALGAVVVYAATKLIKIGNFRRLLRFRKREFSLALVTLVGTMVYGILAGVGLAVALSLLEMGYRLARPSSAVLGRVPNVPGMHNVADYPESETLPGLVIYRYDAPLFFANIGDLQRKSQRIVDQELDAFPDHPVRWFLINVEAVAEVDITASDGLAALHANLASQGIHLGLVRIKRELYKPLQRAGVIDLIGEDFLFPTLPVAEQAYIQWAEANPLQVADDDDAEAKTPKGGSIQAVWTSQHALDQRD
jgi:SulP family sulfate permease